MVDDSGCNNCTSIDYTDTKELAHGAGSAQSQHHNHHYDCDIAEHPAATRLTSSKLGTTWQSSPPPLRSTTKIKLDPKVAGGEGVLATSHSRLPFNILCTFNTIPQPKPQLWHFSAMQLSTILLGGTVVMITWLDLLTRLSSSRHHLSQPTPTHAPHHVTHKATSTTTATYVTTEEEASYVKVNYSSLIDYINHYDTTTSQLPLRAPLTTTTCSTLISQSATRSHYSISSTRSTSSRISRAATSTTRTHAYALTWLVDRQSEMTIIAPADERTLAQVALTVPSSTIQENASSILNESIRKAARQRYTRERVCFDKGVNKYELQIFVAYTPRGRPSQLEHREGECQGEYAV
eukprot:2629744-Amphidinium_carterae.2